MKQIPAALLLAALLGTSLASAPSAAANHTCASAGTAGSLNEGTWQAGTVYAPGISPGGEQDWFFHWSASLTAAVLATGVREPPPPSPAAPHVQANPADAYLQVWDLTCTIVLCETYVTTTDPGACAFSGNVMIRVLYASSHELHVDYTLFLAQP